MFNVADAADFTAWILAMPVVCVFKKNFSVFNRNRGDICAEAKSFRLKFVYYLEIFIILFCDHMELLRSILFICVCVQFH